MQKEDECIGILWERKVTGWELGHEEPCAGDTTPRLNGWLSEYEFIPFLKYLLYRVTADPIHDGAGYQLMVPSTLQALALASVHDKWGHQRTGRTLALLKASCYGLVWVLT